MSMIQNKKMAMDEDGNIVVKRALQDSISAANDALAKITRIYRGVPTKNLDEEGKKCVKRIGDMMLGLLSLEGRLR